jgi:hypothetical protein
VRKLLLRLTRQPWNHRIALRLGDAVDQGIITADQLHLLLDILVLTNNFSMCLCARHETLRKDICHVD